MYTPTHFDAPGAEAIREVLRATAFAAFVSARGSTPIVTHLPVAYVPGGGGWGALRAHFARANPHWRALEAGASVLAICQGPHGYVSPAWYGERSVPTWDYIAVHAWCTPRQLEGDALAALVAELMRHHEARAGTGMRYEDYPADYRERMLRAIVGMEFEIERVEASFKLSQNRSAGDRESVCAQLRASGDSSQAALADAIERYAQEHPAR